MGGCCGKVGNSTPLDLMDAFWENLKIREINNDDVISKINSVRENKKSPSDTQIRLLIENLIEHPDCREISSKIFLKAYEESKKTDEGYFFISLLFLSKATMTDLAEMGEYIKKFVGLWKTQAKNSNAVRDATEKKNATIKAKDLKDFVYYYASLLTIISSPYLVDLADNKQLYMSLVNDYFKEGKLSDYVDITFFNKYKGEEEIDLKSFFRSHLVTFQDDYNIRQQFANFPE